ncbi:unnamed protein product [Rotaria magnacalcarata]|uniref:Uncharacterized protein n=1 Tax=Rotaria magnacalcarata TaxID=392030 RepID=A0A814IC66_9BILA|nr:unnamed protein product [Rotaria magnacalcarata]CAF3954605.1 unnamed protein product [Rotaria magnacalcarata]
MQSWNQFQLVNPSFTMNVPNNDITLLRDVLMSLETSTIEISIIEIRPTYEYDFQNTITTTTFILIGDASGTTFLNIIDLKSDAIFIDKAYILTKMRPKKFNGSTIISTTIDTNISVSTNEIIPNISGVETTLAMDLTDNKIIKVAIDEIGDIQRMIRCLTCKGDLVDVAGDEKTTLWASDLVLEQLLNLVGVSIDDTDTDIASAVLSYGNMLIQYSELCKEIILVMKP